MKHLKDIVSESLLDDDDKIMDDAKWATFFKDSVVAEETFHKVVDIIKEKKPKKFRNIQKDWVIYPYFGVSYFGSTNHGLTIGREGEIYSILWIVESNKKNQVSCSLLKSVSSYGNYYYEIPKELEWIIEVVKSCPNIKKVK